MGELKLPKHVQKRLDKERNKDSVRNQLTKEELDMLHIPKRDKENYPEPSKEDKDEAGLFLLKLSHMAESLDGNLRSLVWDMYIKMNNFLHKGLENAPMELAMSLENLRNYLIESANPVLMDDVMETNLSANQADK